MTGARAASAPRPGLALVVSSSQVWTRRPGETSTAYAAFCTYRDLGPTRTLLAAYQQGGGPKRGPKGAQETSGHWKRWHRRHEWRSRAEAYDAYLDEEKRRAEAQKWRERGEDLVEEQYQLAVAMLEKARQMLAFPLVRQTVEQRDEDGRPTHITIEPVRWTFGTAARLVMVAVELGRLATGLPTKNEMSVHFEVDPAKLSDEQLERIIAGEDPAAVVATPQEVAVLD